MDNYLIDRETLGRFADELIKKKGVPADNAEAVDRTREEVIAALDDHIGMAVFGGFTPEQNTEFNQLLDQDDAPLEAYQEFFDKHHINVEQIITDAVKAFSTEFLGGQNA